MQNCLYNSTSYKLTSRRVINIALLLGLLLSSFSLSACKSTNAKKSEDKEAVAEPAKQEESKGEGKEGDKGDQAGDAAPPTNLYMTIPFGKLNGDQRAAFVKVAKAELCPCDGSTVSLDECLKDKSKSCDIAIAGAEIALDSIQQGKNETDVLDDMTNAVELLKKEYTFTLDGRPFIGAPDAKVKVIEFADFQCPFCKRASEALKELEAANKGKSVAFYYKQFPLSAHEFGEPAARASVAAMNQGKFWEMHKLLFDNQTSLSNKSFDKFAQELGLNLQKFQKDMKSKETAEYVEKDRKEGEDANLQGTPTIFINGRLYVGNPEDKAAFQAKIDQLLAK